MLMIQTLSESKISLYKPNYTIFKLFFKYENLYKDGKLQSVMLSSIFNESHLQE